MKYYFGRVPCEDVNSFGTEGLFEYGQDFFYNQVEIGTTPGGSEDYVISDSVGRSIPLSVDHLSTLIEVLENIQENLEVIKNGKELEELLADPCEIRVVEW
jgi:hypothetical protein